MRLELHTEVKLPLYKAYVIVQRRSKNKLINYLPQIKRSSHCGRRPKRQSKMQFIGYGECVYVRFALDPKYQRNKRRPREH